MGNTLFFIANRRTNYSLNPLGFMQILLRGSVSQFRIERESK
jgi:hypothetical protein